MMNIVEGLAAVSQIVKRCIRDEMCEGGLLEEVNTFIPSYREEEVIDEPAIWLYEDVTTVVEGDGRLSKQVKLRTPFEFVCLVYNEDDLEESELKGKELAGKVAAAIGKNFRRVDDNGNQISSKPVLEGFYPYGAVNINEQSDEIVVTSVRINIDYTVNWVISCINQNNDGD